jgi:hypothetical protein
VAPPQNASVRATTTVIVQAEMPIRITQLVRALTVLSVAMNGCTCASSSESASTIAQPSVTATVGFPLLHATLSLEVSDTAVGLADIGAITAGPDGSIVAVDHNARSIAILSARGKRVREFGRNGSGPGEFERIGPIGWLGDTLVVIDVRLRRITFVTIPDGSVRGVIPWPSTVNGYPWRILSGLHSAVAVFSQSEGPPVPLAFGATTTRRSMHYWPITASGFGAELLSFSAPSALPPPQAICENGAGSIYSDFGPFRDLGPLEGLSSRHSLVTIAPESLLITIRGPTVANPTRKLRPIRSRVSVSDAAWDSVAKEYLALKAKYSTLRCDPPYVRPAFMPAGRMMQVDDTDRIWAEVTERSGTSIHVLKIDGEPVGVFPTPPRDESVPWFVRNNRFYMVAVDTSGLKGVRVYEVER